MDKKCKISVVIPCYNVADVILRCLDSVNNQTVIPFEVILVDDCSSEALSVKFLETINQDFNFSLKILYHKENLGASSARNTGINACSNESEYIAFLDSDDCWELDKLEKQISVINGYDFLYSNYNEKQPPRINNAPAKPFKISYLDILKKNLSPVTLIAKRESVFYFDERFRRCDDFKMSIESLAKGYKIGFLDVPASYGFKKAIGGGGLTKSVIKMSLAYLKACIFLIIEYPKLFFVMTLFISYELFKLPFRLFKVYVLR